jgi:hypothetical protein
VLVQGAWFLGFGFGEFNLQVRPVEFVFAPAERDVHSYERTPNDPAPLGSETQCGTFPGAGKSDCAP